MCGIFGYVGSNEAVPLLIDGLRTLEYRGYDSAGIFTPSLGTVKAVGPIAQLDTKLTGYSTTDTSGIAHTRWATHGEPSEVNAHPHGDMAGAVWVVHNGIIENFQELKRGLQLQGITFTSDTDTEVLTKLIGSYYQGNLLTAVKEALAMVQGAYGIAVMSTKKPDEIVVARMGSPIVLGLALDGNLVASDPSALLSHTKDVVYLEDGELAVLQPDTYEVYSHSGKKHQKQPEVMDWDISIVQKDGYQHFMEKEIFAAPSVITDTLRGRLLTHTGRVKLGGLESVQQRINEIQRLDIVGCGSAYYAGAVGAHFIEQYAQLPVTVNIASEYRYRAQLALDQSAVLAISQSGETADTLAALSSATDQAQLTLGVVNTVGSSIARNTTAGVYNHIGPEIAVASTKAFISQVTIMAMIAILLGRERGLSVATGQALTKALEDLPNILETVLQQAPHIQQLASRYAQYTNALFIGRQELAPVAAEGALKLKEVTYIHAEAYPAGELKHGPIALLDTDFPVIALAPQNQMYEKMVANIQEIKARKAPVLAIVTEGDTQVAALADDVIEIPKVPDILLPVVTTVPLHMLAYYIGVAKSLDVDKPRNLAKSVTVE